MKRQRYERKRPVWGAMLAFVVVVAVSVSGCTGSTLGRGVDQPQRPAPAPAESGADDAPIDHEVEIHTEAVEADGERVHVSVQYPRLAGLADEEVQDAINAVFAGIGEATLARAAMFDEEYDDPFGMPYDFDLSYDVTYNEGGVISVVFHDYMYTGGAHGSTLRYSYTFDLNTGHEYSLGDLLGDRPDWREEASAEISRQFEDIRDFMLAEFNGIEPDQPFFIRDGRIVVYFQQYEYTPYAYGFPEFELPWQPRFPRN